MTNTQSTVTARLDRATADNLLPALTNALRVRGPKSDRSAAGAVNVVLDTATARNLLLSLTHSLQSVGSGKKKKGK
jgi:hypothetical protein